MDKDEAKIKVLHLNAASSGGASIVAARLSNALNQTGKISSTHFVFEGHLEQNTRQYLWAHTFFRKKWAFFLHALEKLQFLFYEKNKQLRFAFSQGLTGIRVSRHPLFKEADIIHLHWINKGFISLKELKRIMNSGKPVVWTCHDMWAFTGGCYHNRGCNNYLANCGNCQYLKKPFPKDLSYRVKTLKREILEPAQKLQLLAPSAWLAAIGKSSLNTKHPVKVIGNATDTQVFSVSNKEELLAQYGFANDEKRILFISGNLQNPRKGFNEFKELLVKYNLNYSEEKLNVIVVGDRWEEMSLTDNKTWKFTFMGYVRDPKKMAELYNLADVYVTTSLEENLPTTVIESLFCGTPVLAFDVGGTREIISDEKLGSVIPCYEVVKMVEAMHRLLNNTEEDNRAYRHQKTNEKYGAENVALQHIKLYKQCLGINNE